MELEIPGGGVLSGVELEIPVGGVLSGVELEIAGGGVLCFTTSFKSAHLREKNQSKIC